MPTLKYDRDQYEIAMACEGTHAEAAAAADVGLETARRWRTGQQQPPRLGAPVARRRRPLPIRHVNPRDARASR